MKSKFGEPKPKFKRSETTTMSVPIPKEAPAKEKVDGRKKLIGNLGAFAHPPKGKKK